MTVGRDKLCAIAVVVICAGLLYAPVCAAFGTSQNVGSRSRRQNCDASSLAPDDRVTVDPKAIELKDDLISIGAATRRGFSASKNDRERVRKIVNDLSMYSSEEPAAAYYKGGKLGSSGSTLSGKWTLIYTDAPDITSLDGGPISTAKLGKIGQECAPPFIKNVIEWKKPEWASSLPFAGQESSRVLQKVCCEGSASPDNPKAVELKLVGLEFSGSGNDDKGGKVGDYTGLGAKMLNGPAGLLDGINLSGPLKAPFGRFEIIFLDDDMRIAKTNQGFITVNIRDQNEWF